MEERDETEREAEAVAEAVVLLSILFGGLVLFFLGWSFEAVKGRFQLYLNGCLR